MERFNLLSVALGLACLAGINLYLTVFVTGLAIHQHWIVLAPSYQSLEILGQPWIIAIAGILYLLEFSPTKFPGSIPLGTPSTPSSGRSGERCLRFKCWAITPLF